MKCLSIRQPWAWTIIHGGKTIENRSWWTGYRGPILIHASKGMTHKEFEEFHDFVGSIPTPGVAWPSFVSLPRGGIVGSADLVDCVTRSDSPWFTEPIGFVLENPKPLPFRPLRGQLSLFEVQA